ncbi:Hcp family type VI secretion system effector [Phormidesmis priestleyi]
MSQYFLKIDGIEGESQDRQHIGEIEVASWSWGESQLALSNPGGGGGAGKVKFQDFQFTAWVSKASPKLFLAGASGQHFKRAILTGRSASEGQESSEFLKITLSDIVVSSFQTDGDASEQRPLDRVSLNFGKIEYEYKSQRTDGTPGDDIKVSWDLKANKTG